MNRSKDASPSQRPPSSLEESISEEEKTILLSLSHEIALLKNRNDLLQIVNGRIKKLFSINELGIAKIDEDGKTYSAFMLDLGNQIVQDADFTTATTDHYDINDALFSQVLHSEDAVVFQVNEIAELHGMPEFVKFWKKVGLRKVLCAALRAAGKNIGMAVLHIDTNETINPKSPLLKGICAQLSVAISNILAIEEIQRREEEKSKLLAFSNAMASSRDKGIMGTVLTQQLKEVLGIKGHYMVYALSKDRERYYPILFDPGANLSNLSKYPDFEKMVRSDDLVSESIVKRILQLDHPIVFNVEERFNKPITPAYKKMMDERGITKITGAPIKLGNEPIGVILFDTNNTPLGANEQLFEGICSQIAIAVSNIIADNEIQGREEEKSKLLAFSNAMASSRDKFVLGKILKQRLIELFVSVNHYILYGFTDDKKYYYPIMFDPETENLYRKLNADFDKIMRTNTLVSDGILERILDLGYPIEFKIEERFKKPMSAVYASIMKDVGVTKINGIPIFLSEKIIAVLFLSTNNTSFNLEEPLFKSICSQIAIAAASIIADNQLLKREEEKTMLLDFSNLIASVRDNESLAKILNRELKRLLGINEYAIHVLSEDKKTHRPVFYDSDAEFARHPLFLEMINKQTDVNDGIFNTILASDEPVTFDTAQWVTLKEPPLYADAAIDIGLKKLTGVRIHLGDENIAVLNFRHDDINILPDHYPLLKSICSQIAIAISNIMTNEMVLNQLNEINRYKQQLEEEKIYLIEEIETNQNFTEIIGDSPEMKKVFRLVSKVASSNSTVLLTGETGTGKELIARAIHNSSPRKNKLMIKVNCAALPVNLIESELFGHERGSFTGAIERRIGKFELANHSTLFLDEIGEMPLELQVKLLRALQEKEIERVGGKTTIKVDARIIAATNRNLENLMEEGRFRTDLFFRLNIFPISLPPLKNRKEDIPSLASHFIQRISKKAGKNILSFSNKALQELINYDWPGNIRELEHLIERSVLLTTGDTIKEIHLPSINKKLPVVPEAQELIIKTIDENEREYILKILKHVNGRISGIGGAAELLGVPPSTLNSKMKRLGIRKEFMG